MKIWKITLNVSLHWLFHVNISSGICCCVWSLPSLDQSRSGQGYGQSKLLSKNTNAVCICLSHFDLGMYNFNILQDKFIFNHLYSLVSIFPKLFYLSVCSACSDLLLLFLRHLRSCNGGVRLSIHIHSMKNRKFQ